MVGIARIMHYDTLRPAQIADSLIRDIEMKNGTVRVVVDLPSDHQFSTAIKEEIIEKIEPLWDVKEVVVEFTE